MITVQFADRYIDMLDIITITNVKNPIYTGPLIRIGIRIKAKPDTCKCANPA